MAVGRDRWDEVVERFNAHFSTSESGEELRYEGREEHLEIRRDGTYSGGMPLHASEGRWNEAEFMDSEVVLRGPESRYVFRR
jgi:hypothetical protein